MVSIKKNYGRKGMGIVEKKKEGKRRERNVINSGNIRRKGSKGKTS